MQALPLTTRTVLLGAANLLRVRGWTTQTMCTPDERMCLVGAIQKFVHESGVEDPVVAGNLVEDSIRQLTRTIWATGVEGKPHPTAWNDRHCKSADAAIVMLERAAG